MLMSPILLNYLGFTNAPTPQVVTNAPELDEDKIKALLEEELTNTIAHISTLHPDTEEYTVTSQNIKTLTEAIQTYEKTRTERDRIQLQVVQAQKEYVQNYNVVALKGLGIIAYGAMMMFWIGLERNNAIPAKMVQSMNTLVRPAV